MRNDRFANYSIIFDKKSYSGGELEQIKQRIRDCILTVIPDNQRPVGVCMKRSVELLVVTQVLFEEGFTIVPIGFDYPLERQKYILEDARVSYVLTDGRIQFQDVTCIDITSNPMESTIICSRIENEVAYVLYTSGTTGKPKGVEVTVQGMMNFLDAMPEKVAISSDDVVCCLTENTFDIFFFETLYAMSCGATISVAKEEEQNNPSYMMRLIEETDVSILQMTPSRMSILLSFDKELMSLSKVKKILLAGEVFPGSLLKTMQKKLKSEIYNGYGPSETTIYTTIANLTDSKEVAIGTPLNHILLKIMDEDGNCVPKGEEGEIWIGGPCLAKGYSNSKELTDSKFRYGKDGNRYFMSGDFGKVDESGNLLFLGRKDSQVKIRGFRVEIEETEEGMKTLIHGIKNAIVCYMKNEYGGILVGYYISDEELAEDDIRSRLGEFYPNYMIPEKFIRVPKLLYTSSKKADRNAMLLTYPLQPRQEEIKHEIEQEMDETFLKVLNVITEILECEKDSAIHCKDLRDVGMNSLRFISIIVDLEDLFGIEFEDDMLSMGRLRTPSAFSEYIDSLLENQQMEVRG